MGLSACPQMKLHISTLYWMFVSVLASPFSRQNDWGYGSLGLMNTFLWNVGTCIKTRRHRSPEHIMIRFTVFCYSSCGHDPAGSVSPFLPAAATYCSQQLEKWRQTQVCRMALWRCFSCTVHCCGEWFQKLQPSCNNMCMSLTKVTSNDVSSYKPLSCPVNKYNNLYSYTYTYGLLGWFSESPML